jgi:sugar O-acyltransferase (sialic acid O-acetyltransferase NeuD family)
MSVKIWQYPSDGLRRLVIVGAGEFAEIAYEYFTHDSPYQVVGFSVERDFIKATELCGLPVVPFDEIEARFPSDQHAAFVAVTYTQLNRVRARLYGEAKRKGYICATYVSSRAFVWHTASLGENVFVFEGNVVQHGVCIGNDVILWSGNHVGHRTRIADHCYLASHIVISGYCSIGEACFIGVNATLADKVTVGRNCLIGAGAVILQDAEDNTLFKVDATSPSRVSSLRFYRIREDN